MKNLQTEQTQQTEQAFRLRTYKKNELAMMYFPDVTKDAASRNFRRWIRQCPSMMKELEAMGYDKNRQYLLKAEVEVIVKHLGEPF
ncbi:DUF4248 domain-containing protein [Bacteroides caecigallinarum]|uniref:DUF4248 domain-containing protein n=1 Tax=Bacteroides caecigallinarum TaxID=1411144 RepID=UPI00195D3E58|nr:DUF4248 domain-containing protein [Bacteroides caecigallinarum]MBM6884002.1 DUF4248 domain-containing protein [Bacteroides caecigallinarum]